MFFLLLHTGCSNSDLGVLILIPTVHALDATAAKFFELIL